jgi:stage II sporulation protein M
MKKLRLLFADMRYMNKYLIAAIAVFLTGLLLGIDGQDRYTNFIQQQMQGLQQIAAAVQGKEHPELWMFLYIFWNNVKTTLLVVFLGIFFGVIPIAVLIVNGMVLGYVGSVQASTHSWWYVVEGVAPHGIIEIPAVIIACAYGIRLGFIVLKSLGALVIPGWGARVRAELAHVLKLTIPLAVVLALALLIAAGIESTVTYWIVKT